MTDSVDLENPKLAESSPPTKWTSPPSSNSSPPPQDEARARDDDDENSVKSNVSFGSRLLDNKVVSTLQNIPSPRKWFFTAVILLLGAAGSIAFTTIGIAARQDEHEEEHRHEASELVNSIQMAMEEYDLFGLWVHQACFKSPQRQTNIDPTVDIEQYIGMCSRDEFSNIYAHLTSRTEIKFQAVQFVPKIWPQERDELERQSRLYYQENYPDFDYKGMTDPFTNPETGETEIRSRANNVSFYWPVHYVEPLATNENAVELDAYANERRARVINKTVRTFQPTLSSGIRLVQETDPNALGLILRHPGIPSNTLQPMEPTFITQIIIRIPDMLARAIKNGKVHQAVYLFDTSSSREKSQFLGAVDSRVGTNGTTTNTLLPATELSALPQDDDKKMSFHHDLQVADRTWTVVVTDQGDSPSMVYIILGGIAIFLTSVLLAVWFHTHMSRLAKYTALRSQAEEEKARLAHLQAVKEREMNEFLSHEVRNPLSSAISALSFVTSSVHDPEQCSFSNDDTRQTVVNDLGVMHNSLQFINDLLRNMLEVHRSSIGEIEINLKPLDIRQDVLEPVRSIIFSRVASRSVEVRVECPDELICLADRMRLKQITLNLASNSVKFVEQGYISLSADSVNGSVVISVSDSGPGIPLSKRNSLFSKYQKSLDALSQGTGLGLSLCKKLSDLMGADLWLDESFDSGIDNCVGTRFVLDLHQPAILPETQSDASAERLPEPCTDVAASNDGNTNSLPESLHVLFTDDDMILRRMFVRSLKRTCPDWIISESSNGETALRMAEGTKFDVIFMDHYMASFSQQMLGTETVRALRARGVESLICGLSANDKEKEFKDAGADCFLFKPFPCEKEALTRELSRILRSRNNGLEED